MEPDDTRAPNERMAATVVLALALLGLLALTVPGGAQTGIAVLGFFAAIIGLLCTSQAEAWCPRPSRRART
jgi:hypothetical protein